MVIRAICSSPVRIPRATSPFLPRAWRSTPSRAHALIWRRAFHGEALLLPPLVFCGLLGTLWLWKCTMMVVFQNKIIYMPGLPPNARRERIEDYARQCGGVQWEERRTRAADGTDLALCVATVTSTGGQLPTSTAAEHAATPVYVLYFQGNASSLPPRLPDLSLVLRALQQKGRRPASYTMVCLSYRGYWTSRGRASEKGIKLDAQAALEYVARLHEASRGDTKQPRPVFILWGQSIGAGVATNLAAWDEFPANARLDALLLETPFLSVRAMLESLYPQKWMPYRHLWPFLWNHLDNWANLGVIAARSKASGMERPRIVIVEAGKDELVPADHGAKLYERCMEVGLPVEKKTVRGAYHSEAVIRAEGKRAVADSIEQAVADAQARDGGENAIALVK